MEDITLPELKTIFQIPKEEAEIQFAPYFYQYFQCCFSSATAVRHYARLCKHILGVTQAKGKRVLDVGCGFGLISIYLGVLGAEKVTSVDHNEEKVSVFQRILARFDPPLTNIEIKREDALSLPYQNESFDVVIANDIISHVRDLDAFLFETKRVLVPGGGILYIADGNNALSPLVRYWTRKIWRKAEYGPVDEAGLRGTDKPAPWLVLRRKVIEEKFPSLDSKTLNLLAKETAGLYGEQIPTAVEGYLREGYVANPPFKFRNPETGEYPEFGFNPYVLKRKLERSGFSTQVIKPYLLGYPLSSTNEMLIRVGWAMAQIMRITHPLSILIAPGFNILCRKL